MSSKKNGSKNLFENMPVEPEHLPQGNSESKDDKALVPQNSNTEEPALPTVNPKSDERPKPERDDTATDEILEDVRRSLIEEEETKEQEGQQKWWKRIGRKSRRNTGSLETPKPVEEINLPRLDVEETISESKPETEATEEVDELDDLIDLLAAEQPAADKELMVPELTPPPSEQKPEPEKVPDIEELKKQAFEPRSTDQDQNLTEVRSVALEGNEEVFVEVETTKQNQLDERLTAAENALKPYQRQIYVGLAVLGTVMAVIAGLVLYNLYRQTVAASVPTPIPSNVPYPTAVSLPGGWTFKLGQGTLVNGSWNPNGAEWLQGTEVCRWVALPWSKQLEAVVRTLNTDDPIKLGMSNNDTLTYKVYSVRQMSPSEMQELDTNTPCLLLVLVQPDSDKRWVLTSLP
jgi:hypothetical protein